MASVAGAVGAGAAGVAVVAVLLVVAEGGTVPGSWSRGDVRLVWATAVGGGEAVGPPDAGAVGLAESHGPILALSGAAAAPDTEAVGVGAALGGVAVETVGLLEAELGAVQGEAGGEEQGEQ